MQKKEWLSHTTRAQLSATVKKNTQTGTPNLGNYE